VKALHICLFLMLLNASFWALDQIGLWGVKGPAGINPQGMENVPVTYEIPGTSIALGSKWTLGILLLGVLSGGVVYLTGARITTPQVVGIFAFVGIFSFMFANTVGILQDLMVPDELIAIITGMNYFALVMAVIQMSTGMSAKHAW